MNRSIDPDERQADYRAQLAHCARSLARADIEAARPYLPAGMPVDPVSMFVEGNLDKRLLKLTNQLELFEDAFDDLEALLKEYIRQIPLSAYDTGCTFSQSHQTPVAALDG